MTDNTQHTPGPWSHEHYDHTSFAADKYKNDYFMRIEWNPEINDAEKEANSALIATAPELLAEAIKAVEMMKAAGIGFNETGLRSAIAKARGE